MIVDIDRHPFDPNVAVTIHRLQNRDVLTVGITNTPTVEHYEEEKTKALAKLGITFPCYDEQDIVFTNLPMREGSYPTYRCGILFTNGESKEVVVDAFIDALHLKPKKVLFWNSQDPITH